MIKFSANTKKQLLDLYKAKNIGLEGNLLKIVDSEEDSEFSQYIKACIDKDKESRKKRLDITKQIQNKNTELQNLNSEKKLKHLRNNLNLKIPTYYLGKKKMREFN